MNTKIGFIGLGRMGLNMVEHLLEKKYFIVGHDISEEACNHAAGAGAHVVDSINGVVGALEGSRTIWLMVPSKFVDVVLEELVPLLQEGDTVIDGGNSFYKDSIERHKKLQEKGIHYLDCGTSGGMEGARHGASLMVGGDREVFMRHEELFRDLAAPEGYGYVGGNGAGHFVKMVHNGIEYGMMGAIAEGINVLNEHKSKLGIDVKTSLRVYDNESIIDSRLVSWLREAFKEGQIDTITGEVPKGETESEMEHIIDIADVKVLEAAVNQRKETRDNPSYIGKLIAAMRNQFGGHATIKK